MKEFDTIKKEFFEFLEYDRGIFSKTIENYERDLNVYSNFIQKIFNRL